MSSRQSLLAFLLLPLLAALATGQTAPRPAALTPTAAAEQPVQLEAFTVTGSNIRRVEAETALPVTVIETVDLDARGAATMSELFETLGMAEISGITEINNGPQLARGDVASVDLRGLGSGSTLTLVNGRRMAPHPISMAEGGVPSLAANINAVPRALVGRVEILRDGASAIYGADAAAGVINNYVSRSYAGRQLSLRGSMTQHGGANEFGVTAAEGFKRGKNHFAVSFDYFHRDALAAHDRTYSRNADNRNRSPAPWNGLPVTLLDGTLAARDNDFNNRNNVNQWGEWQRGTIQPDYLTFVGSRPANNVGITTSTTPPAGVATMSATGMFYLYPQPDGSVYFNQSRPSSNIDSAQNYGTQSNWNKWKTLIPRTDRWQFGLFADRPLTDRVSFFGDVMFYAAHTFNGREPVNAKNTDDPGMYLPAANPYNPFGVRFYHPTGAPNADGTPRLVGTPADVSIYTGISPGQNTGGGFKPRSTEVFSYSFRTLAGLRGKFGESWEWESAVMYSGAQTHEFEHYQIRESRLRAALYRTDATAMNPFPVTFKIVNNQIVVDKAYENPASVLDALYDDEDRFGRTQLLTWDAKTNGRLWRLPFGGGRLGLATGAEYRYETYRDGRAAYVGVNPPGSGAAFPLLREGDNDFLALSPNVPIDAHQSVFATFAEVALPFVTRENRKPLLEALELSLAGRFEHFSIFGQATKPKASMVWNPARWLKFRSSIADSFRAPNLVQTNVAALKRQFSASDSYRSTVTGLATDGSVQRTSYRQGNQNLKPEKSQTTSGGLVLEVPKLRGLSVTFDYFKINQTSVIQNRGAAATLAEDATLLQIATQAALAAGTPADQIDLGSGAAAYKGSDAVTRAPLTAADRAAFAAYNARQASNATRRAPVGEFVSVVDSYINLAGRDLQGYEVGINYRSPATRVGRFTIGGEATHYLVRRSQTNPSTPVLSELGRNGRVSWRASGNASWRQGAWGAGWFTSYFDSFVDTGAETTQAIYQALGGPDYIKVFNDNGALRYLLRVKPSLQHNAWISYRFERGASLWLRGTTVRLGINNAADTDPRLTSDQYGFRSGSANPRGRQFTFDVSRAF
ncbi:MAG: TonB-dependent receptor [Verrucomicrobia bacterium]|nr:TonB-dependent receptor [Verrucomicrobiota bacterium]